MKRINIKVDSCFWKTEGGQCPTTASFSLPDNIESVVVTEGDSYYTGTIFKLAENSYSYIAVVPLLNNIFIGDTLYSQLQQFLNAANIQQYLEVNLLKEELNAYDNRFEKSRLDLTASFRELFLNSDDVYDYDLAVPLPDQKLLDVITRVWQNNSIDSSPNADLNATYKKGDQITVSDQYSAYRTLFESAYGKTFASNNVWPGRSNGTYFCAIQFGGFVTAAQASTDMASKSLDCFTTQCDQFKERFFDPDQAAEYAADLNKQLADLQDQQEELASALADAVSALEEAETNLKSAAEQYEQDVEKAQDAYEKCVEDCDGDPDCIAKCAAARDENIAEAQAELDAAQAAVDKAQADVDAAATAVKVVDQLIAEIQEELGDLETITKLIEELCNNEGGAEQKSAKAPAIPEDAFDLLTNGDVNDLFEAWVKNQAGGKELAADIQKAVASEIGINGQVGFTEPDGKRYATVGGSFLNEPQAAGAAKAIKMTIHSQGA